MEIFKTLSNFSVSTKSYSFDKSYHSTSTQATLVMLPTTEKQISSILKTANQLNYIVITVAGRSSLEGQTLPILQSQSDKRKIIILDLSDMDAIVKINKDDHDCQVEAGVSWIELKDVLEKDGLFFPPDPGMQALIGGMCGTNCSGTLAHRYGTTKDNIVGLRVVLANGEIIQTKQRPHKSSAGYDLTRLFIGSEGTLGVITQATLRLQSIPAYHAIILAQFKTIENAATVASAVVKEGLHLHRLEFLDEYCLKSINLHEGNQEHKELPTLLFECAARTRQSVQEQIDRIKEISHQTEHECLNFAVASDKEGAKLWKIRKSAFFASKTLRPEIKDVHVLTTDCAVPISRLSEFLHETRKDLDLHFLKASIVAHAGDGNTHVFLLVDPSDKADIQRAEEFRHRNATLAIGMEGTCTGEHGIGLGKKKSC